MSSPRTLAVSLALCLTATTLASIGGGSPAAADPAPTGPPELIADIRQRPNSSSPRSFVGGDGVVYFRTSQHTEGLWEYDPSTGAVRQPWGSSADMGLAGALRPRFAHGGILYFEGQAALGLPDHLWTIDTGTGTVAAAFERLPDPSSASELIDPEGFVLVNGLVHFFAETSDGVALYRTEVDGQINVVEDLSAVAMSNPDVWVLADATGTEHLLYQLPSNGGDELFQANPGGSPIGSGFTIQDAAVAERGSGLADFLWFSVGDDAYYGAINGAGVFQFETYAASTLVDVDDVMASSNHAFFEQGDQVFAVPTPSSGAPAAPTLVFDDPAAAVLGQFQADIDGLLFEVLRAGDRELWRATGTGAPVQVTAPGFLPSGDNVSDIVPDGDDGSTVLVNTARETIWRFGGGVLTQVGSETDLSQIAATEDGFWAGAQTGGQVELGALRAADTALQIVEVDPSTQDSVAQPFALGDRTFLVDESVVWQHPTGGGATIVEGVFPPSTSSSLRLLGVSTTHAYFSEGAVTFAWNGVGPAVELPITSEVRELRTEGGTAHAVVVRTGGGRDLWATNGTVASTALRAEDIDANSMVPLLDGAAFVRTESGQPAVLWFADADGEMVVGGVVPDSGRPLSTWNGDLFAEDTDDRIVRVPGGTGTPVVVSLPPSSERLDVRASGDLAVVTRDGDGDTVPAEVFVLDDSGGATKVVTEVMTPTTEFEGPIDAGGFSYLLAGDYDSDTSTYVSMRVLRFADGRFEGSTDLGALDSNIAEFVGGTSVGPVVAGATEANDDEGQVTYWQVDATGASAVIVVGDESFGRSGVFDGELVFPAVDPVFGNEPHRIALAVPEPDPVDEPDVVSLAPRRFFESRAGETTFDGQGQSGRRVAAGETVRVQVTGRGGVAAGTSGVVVNVTAVFPAGPGFVTVWDCTGDRPTASSLNYGAGAVVPNELVAKLSATGELCLFSRAETDLLVDVVGLVPGGSALQTLAPRRFFESREGESTFDGLGQAGARVAGGETVRVQVTGRGGVPAGTAGVIANVTAVFPSGPGFVTVWDCQGDPPTASSLNYGAGAVVPNELVSKLSPSGELCLFTRAETDLLVDVVGLVPAGSDIVSLTPARFVETRPGEATFDGDDRLGRRLAAGETLRVQVAGRGAVAAGASGVVANVTAVFPSAPGFVTVWDCQGDPPTASSLNYGPGQVVPNELIAKLSPTGELCVFTRAETDLLLDVVGAIV